VTPAWSSAAGSRITSPLIGFTQGTSAGGARCVPPGARIHWRKRRAWLAWPGDPLHAGIRYRRALELILEARALDPRAEDEGAILELSRLVPIHTLDPRYRERVGATD
jgi:hypothetical protein